MIIKQQLTTSVDKIMVFVYCYETNIMIFLFDLKFNFYNSNLIIYQAF